LVVIVEPPDRARLRLGTILDQLRTGRANRDEPRLAAFRRPSDGSDRRAVPGVEEARWPTLGYRLPVHERRRGGQLISADLQQLADGGELLWVLGAFELVLGSLLGLLRLGDARRGFVGCAREVRLERLDVRAERVDVLLGGVSYLVGLLVMVSEKGHGRGS
jgi:hypothetical protein